MMTRKANRPSGRGLTELRKRTGRRFVLMWEIGFIIFFLIPLGQSLIYAFSEVKFDVDGFIVHFSGLKNFYEAFYESPKYVDNLTESIASFCYSIPFLIALSLIIALLLNQKFVGRTVYRAVFFLPVIISTGVIIEFIRDDSAALALLNSGKEGGSMYFRGLIDFDEVMRGLGLPDSVQNFLMTLVNEIYQLLWNAGIPVTLFIAGLQSIPDQLYEVSRVEGATKWEEFWHITFPMLGNTLVLVLAYVSIDMFTVSSNPVMKQVLAALQDQIYDTSAAMLWAYFLIVGGGLALLILLFNRLCLRKWE